LSAGLHFCECDQVFAAALATWGRAESRRRLARPRDRTSYEFIQADILEEIDQNTPAYVSNCD
jgi:hypothetical protein